MRNSESANLFTYNYFWKLVYLNYKCGFYSSISLIQSGQTNELANTHTNTQQLSFINIDRLLGIYGYWKQFGGTFNETSVGKAINSIDAQSTSNDSYLHYRYLADFVKLHISGNDDQLFKVCEFVFVVCMCLLLTN